MLNGIDPLLVIVIKKKPPPVLFGPPEPPGLGALLDLIGIPIPIYLAENPLAKLGSAAPGGAAGRAIGQSGVYVESETRSIDLGTKVDPTTTPDPLTGDTAQPQISQRVYDTQVTVNLIASRDSVIITALVAMMEFLLNRIANQEYAIHYINRSTVIFGGLLNRFATSVNPNEDKIHIEMTLSTSAKALPITKPPLEGIKNTATIGISTPPAG